MLTPQQSRSARAFLNLGVRDLARIADVSPNTIARLERGEALHSRTLDYLKGVFEAAGVEFIAPGAVSPVGGHGVRAAEHPNSDLGKILEALWNVPDLNRNPHDAYFALLGVFGNYLDLVEREGRQLDTWERAGLNDALNSLNRSSVHLAAAEIRHAITPPDNQSREYPISAETAASVSDLDLAYFRRHVIALRSRGYIGPNLPDAGQPNANTTAVVTGPDGASGSDAWVPSKETLDWDDTRREILRWLQNRAPPLAEMYQSAVTLMSNADFPSRGRLVAHALREIANNLPSYFAQFEPGRADYAELVRKIVPGWRDAGLPIGQAAMPETLGRKSGDLDGHVRVPASVTRQIAELLDEHEKASARNADRAATLFEAINKELHGRAESVEPTIRQWLDTCRWFVSKCHLDRGRARADDEIFTAEFRARFEEFEALLYALIAKFYDIIDDLDVDITSDPTPENIGRIVSSFGRAAARRYFFSKQKNPKWLLPLRDRGFFKSPPSAEVDEAQGTVAYPDWPESSFLLRVAREEPKLVSEIVAKIPETDNARVHGDLIRIALELPASMSASIAVQATKWISPGPSALVFGERLPSLIAHLARGGQISHAFKLAGAVFAIQETPAAADVGMRRAHTWQDHWNYQAGLKTCLPALIEANPARAIQFTAGLLLKSLQIAGLVKDGEEGYDVSHVVADVGSLENDLTGDMSRLLVAALGETSIKVAASGQIDPADVIQKLEKRKWAVFRSIALYVLTAIKPAALLIATARMTDRTLFRADTLEGPYSRLVKGRFRELEGSDKDRIIGWILNGPDLQRAATYYERLHGKPADAGILESHRKHWIRERLRWIETDLPERPLGILHDLELELGPPDSGHNVGFVWGTGSPKTAEELNAMSAAEIAEFLKRWEANPDDGGVSPEGLGRELRASFRGRVGELASEFGQFIGVQPTYVRHLLEELTQVVRQGISFPWQPVFALCRWATEQPRGDEKDEGRYVFADESWIGVRRSIGQVVRAGLENKGNPIPESSREEVWHILATLADDPDPSVSEEGTLPSHVSIATVRGEAMHAIVRYAVWVRQLLEKGGSAPAVGLDATPEVRDVLDRRLDPERDSSPAIRSVYGQYFPTLTYLDEKWAKKSARKIFPGSEHQRPLWLAGWLSYLQFSGAYDNVFNILEPQYVLGVQRINEKVSQELVGSAYDNLGAHLMAFYWRGKIDLSKGGLLHCFLENSPDELRRRTFEFVGRSLLNSKEPVPEPIVARLQALWSSRFALAQETGDKEKFKPELQTFGIWFASGKFEVAWSIKTLLDVLQFIGEIGLPHLVMQRLHAIAPEHPSAAMRCLHSLLVRDQSAWRYGASREELTAIIEQALGCGDPEAKALAESTIHIMGERGDDTLRSLLTR